jgi:hypothetical protein
VVYAFGTKLGHNFFLKYGSRSRGVNISSLIINLLTNDESYIEMAKIL